MHIFGVFLLFIVLSHSYVTFPTTQFVATKEQHVPATTAQGTCTIDISFDDPTSVLLIDVDCGTGLGAQITAAHIHKLNTPDTTPLLFGTGDPVIFLLTAPLTGNTFMFENDSNVRANIDVLCNNQAYLNIHTPGETNNVRANLLLNKACNLGTVPTDKKVASWGPAPAVGDMKPWTINVDVGDTTTPAKCMVSVTYKPGEIYISGSCAITDKIKYIYVYDIEGTNYNGSTPVVKFFEETAGGFTAFYGEIPFSFDATLSNSDRDELCKSTATAMAPWTVVIGTDMGAEYAGKIVIDACPAVGAAPAPSGALSLSATVYLTVLALFSKWLF
jgi:hypothetical protein